MNNRFINVDQACELLNLSKSTLYKMTSAKKIPFYKCGRRVLFVQDELFQFVINLNGSINNKVMDDDSFLITALAS